MSDGVRFTCPFCGKDAIAVAEPPSVIHAIPVCERFVALDVTEYLHAVNEVKKKMN